MTARCLLAGWTVIALFSSTARAAEDPPDGALGVVAEALPIDALVEPMEREDLTIAVAVAAAPRAEWENLSAELQKALRKRLSTMEGISETRGFETPKVVAAMSDEDIARRAAKSGVQYVVVARLYNGQDPDAPPVVALSVLSAAGKALKTLTVVDVIVRKGMANKALDEVSKSFKKADKDARKRVKKFVEKALKAKVRVTTSYYRGSVSTTREVIIFSDDGKELDDADLMELTTNQEIKDALSAHRRDGWIENGMCLGTPLLCCGGPVVLGGIGCLLGGIIGWPLAVVGLVVPQMATLTSLVLAPLYAGAAGVGAGCLLGMFSGCIVGTSNWVFTKFIKTTPTDGQYSQVITEHNKKLAEKLGLDPESLDPEYFPAGL